MVLLIDEIDKTDQEFEAMLLEVLSDFQISIPELGRVESRTHPVVLLTSNNSRELTEALKRRCLYLWLDYPELEHELEIVRLHAPELSETVARRLVEVVGMVRELDLKKPPSIAESIDWARALLLLGADDIDEAVVQGHDVGDRQAPHRHGHRLRARRDQAGPTRPLGRRLSRPPMPPEGLPARILELGEELRREGVAVGTSELLDAFAVLREVSWTEQEDFREALAATLAKSQEDRRVFELVFDRFFFRAVELAALREDVREGDPSQAPPGAIDLDELSVEDLEALRAQIAAALRDGSEGAMRDLARMAIAAFGRREEGSGVIGVDVQRIRRALGLRTEPQPDLPPEDPRREGLPRDALRRFEALLRRELERGQIERTGSLPPSRPLGELDRALPSGPLADLAAVHRVVTQLRRRLATQGMQARGHRRHAQVDVRRTMRASLQTGGVPVVLKYRPRRPRRPEIYVLCDVSTSVTSASVFFLSVLHALHDSFRKMRSFVFIERVSEVTDIFAHERNFKAVSRTDLLRRRRGRHLRLHRLRPRVVGDAGAGRRRPAPARHGDRARRRAHERPRSPLRPVRPARRARRAHVLAEPRAAPVLELRGLGDRRLRGVLHRVRVLDDRTAGGLRASAHPAGLIGAVAGRVKRREGHAIAR